MQEWGFGPTLFFLLLQEQHLIPKDRALMAIVLVNVLVVVVKVIVLLEVVQMIVMVNVIQRDVEVIVLALQDAIRDVQEVVTQLVSILFYVFFLIILISRSVGGP